MPSVAPPPFLGFDSFALGFARVIFLVSTIASFAIVRIAAALLLALAPLFVAFLLFDGTRGLFEGWAKRSEEHTSELQSLMRISYAVFCLKKKKKSNKSIKQKYARTLLHIRHICTI